MSASKRTAMNAWAMMMNHTASDQRKGVSDEWQNQDTFVDWYLTHPADGILIPGVRKGRFAPYSAERAMLVPPPIGKYLLDKRPARRMGTDDLGEKIRPGIKQLKGGKVVVWVLSKGGLYEIVSSDGFNSAKQIQAYLKLKYLDSYKSSLVKMSDADVADLKGWLYHLSGGWKPAAGQEEKLINGKEKPEAPVKTPQPLQYRKPALTISTADESVIKPIRRLWNKIVTFAKHNQIPVDPRWKMVDLFVNWIQTYGDPEKGRIYPAPFDPLGVYSFSPDTCVLLTLEELIFVHEWETDSLTYPRGITTSGTGQFLAKVNTGARSSTEPFGSLAGAIEWWLSTKRLVLEDREPDFGMYNHEYAGNLSKYFKANSQSEGYRRFDYWK